MAGCPEGVVDINSSMVSTCLRTNWLSTCAPICGHSMSSRVIRSTESLARFAAGPARCVARSVGTDSLFRVALCTDTLHDRDQISFAALQSAAPAAANDCFAAKCMILMENGIPRDGLDHILDAVQPHGPVSRRTCNPR